MMSVPFSEQYDLLDRLAEEFAARFRRGERPALKEYTDRYPELADEIRELFPALVKVERAKGLRQGDLEKGDLQAASPPLYQVGDYRILREIGHGGMGVVYEAEQISLGRRVALKMLPRGVARDPRMFERFRREARAAARLHHTNIVPVFEVGREGNDCYYAMQFIQGQALDLVYDEIRRLRGQPRDAGVSRSRLARLSHEGLPVAGEHPSEHGPTLAGVSEFGPVVHSLLTGRFNTDSGLAAAGEGMSPHVPSTRDDGCAAGPVAAPFAGETPLAPATEGRAAGTASPASIPDVPVSGSPHTSAVLPGGTQISSVESGGSKYARSVARIGLQAALGLAYAHARGVVHRDIKPSNLLLDTDGVVWITDFGLAKSDDDRLTQTGDIVGTVRYMAPERFRGEADVRSDIYALGLTLYELLTLEPAFNTRDRLRLIEQVKGEDPIAPRVRDRRVPRDLETIILKAIDKDPKRRYATADAMAEDLRRFLHDEPIMARRQTHFERYVRWARRHPGIASMGAALTAVLVLATAWSLVAAAREHGAKLLAQSALKKAESDHLEAEAQRDRAEWNLYAARIGQAESSLRLFDPHTARALLDQCIPKPGGPDRRGWEWSYLDRWCSPELRTLKLATNAETNVLAVSPDGRLLLVGCAAIYGSKAAQEPLVPTCVIDLRDGKVRYRLAGHGTWVSAVAFAPDGKRLAVSGNEGAIKVWETETGRELRNLGGIGAAGNCLAWSPDGRRLASAHPDGFVRIWDPETGHETARISHTALHLAWSPDGTRIAAAGSGDQVRIWAAADGQPSGPVQSLGANGIAWAPDGRRLAGVSRDGSLVVWDTASGQTLFAVKQISQLSSVAFSPDGNRLATGGTEGIIRLHDARSGREHAAVLPGCENVSSLAFSPDGGRLFAAGGGMGGVKIFDTTRDPRGRGVTPWLDQSAALAFVGESDRLRGIGWQGGQLATVSFSTGGMRYQGNFPVIDLRGWPRGDFSFNADGRLLAAPLQRDPTAVGIWDVELGRLTATLCGNSPWVTAVAFSPDGLRLATAALDEPKRKSAVTIWDLGRARPFLSFDVNQNRVVCLAYSSDSRKIAAGGGESDKDDQGWVTVWDAENGALVRALDRLGRVACVAFHPDGTLLAIADPGNTSVLLWDITANTLITRPAPRAVVCVAFSHDGTRLAALGHSGSVHLADARTGEQVLVLRCLGPPLGTGGWTPRLTFSADGSRIAAQMSNFLNLWEAGPLLNSQVEPNSEDVAGWLRRSRSFATGGNGAQALAAFEHALAIPTDVPEPWIRHALAEGTEPDQAELAFARAFKTGCDDPIRWLACARELERFDRKHEAATASKIARQLAEKRLAGAADDEPAAWVLADLMKDGMSALADGNWSILVPSEMASAGGAKLTRLPDGSILASGANPDQDSLTIVARTELAGITGLRLEVLPDPSLHATGPGRQYKWGDLHMSGLSVAVAPGDDFSKSQPIEFSWSVATNVQPRAPFANPPGAIARKRATRWGWDLREQIGLRNAIAFATAGPVDAPAGSTWIIRLDCDDARWKQRTLGRFRLSVTSAPVTLFETSLHKALTEPEWNGRTRLGVAYYLQGVWPAAARALQIAADSPEANGTDRFLLALALHHLDRHDEAHRYLESGVAWLRLNRNSGTLRTLVVEAIALIDGVSRTQAEALMFLDPMFPAEAFAR